MQYYRVKTSPPTLVPTRAAAIRAAESAETDFDLIDVPLDKNGLMEYINSALRAAGPSFSPKAAPTGSEAAAIIRQLDAEQLSVVAHSLGRRITDLTS